MTWQAPWTLLALGAIAVPIVIHLLGRGRARYLPFPTLRFFGTARPLPIRRTRLHDRLLLTVRIGIVAAAVAALAQPRFRTAARARAFDATLARAVIVDTSSSMQRRRTAGGPALDAAVRDARLLADSAGVSIVLRTARPSRAIAGAVAWLDRQPGRSELVVLSDFQRGALDSTDIAAVPQHVGVRLDAIRVADAPVTVAARHGDADVAARVTPLADGNAIEWTTGPPGAMVEHDGVTLLAGATDSAAAAAAGRAAATIGVPLPVDTARHIAIVFPGYPGRSALLAAATPIRTAWMSDALARVGSDAMLAASAAASGPTSTSDAVNTIAMVPDSAGHPVILAASGNIAGHQQLLLFPLVEAGSLTSAALIAAVEQATSIATPPAELDPSVVPDTTLARWQRPPTPRTTPGPQARLSDSRWFWMVALVLLAIETLLRRRPSVTPIEAVADAAH